MGGPTVAVMVIWLPVVASGGADPSASGGEIAVVSVTVVGGKMKLGSTTTKLSWSSPPRQRRRSRSAAGAGWDRTLTLGHVGWNPVPFQY